MHPLLLLCAAAPVPVGSPMEEVEMHRCADPGSPPASRRADTPAAARGRKLLSTALVRVGPDGILTVELHDGRLLVLRDVVLRPSDYCAAQVIGGVPGARHCGGYADVAAARAGGGPARDDSVPLPTG